MLASRGFWEYFKIKKERNDMLRGLGHDRIMFLGMKYIDRGWITADEYENLYDYLYIPYKKMGGNGSAERVMNEVQKLKITNEKEQNYAKSF